LGVGRPAQQGEHQRVRLSRRGQLHSARRLRPPVRPDRNHLSADRRARTAPSLASLFTGASRHRDGRRSRRRHSGSEAVSERPRC
jgi:hypothetical protein